MLNHVYVKAMCKTCCFDACGKDVMVKISKLFLKKSEFKKHLNMLLSLWLYVAGFPLL